MSQENIWEKEYRNPKLVTKHSEPQSVFLKFLKYLKKEEKVDVADFSILDLGSGTGRNSNYLAEKGATVIGIEISETAIKLAEQRAKNDNLSVKYIKQSIGKKYPFEDKSFDLVIDVTSSNSLNEKEREIYLSEVNRVLKDGRFFFVRALCKDGDENAKKLLKISPAGEKDTYIMPELGLRERVFSKEDFVSLYSKYFKILKLEKTESYSSVGERKYKRKFWVAYLEKLTAGN